MAYRCISVEEAKELIAQEAPHVIDIRDGFAYTLEHVPSAINANEATMRDFFASADRAHPVLCYCYHGISSQGAAQSLVEEGFQRVYSMDGGYEAWKQEDETRG